MANRRMKVAAAIAAVGVSVSAVVWGTAASADSESEGQSNAVSERLSGLEETPLALSTTGTGQFLAHIDPASQQVDWELSYSGLEGAVLQAHIHFGAVAQSGGIAVFLCTNLGNGPAGTQACPAAPATVSGTFGPADVIGPAGQGIAAGQFDELLAALRADTTYANVHSTLYPAGEIRGQIDHGH